MQVQRQTSGTYRQAIEVLREQPARGFEQLVAMGAVREVAWEDRSRSVAEAWRQAHAHPNASGQPSSVLVVCATHDDIAQVTAAIRSERSQRGEIGQGVQLDRYVPLHYTQAQKDDPRQFQVGQVLVSHDRPPHDRGHEALEITHVEPHRLIVRTPEGDPRVVPATEGRGFDVYERRPIEIAPHDRLLLTANREEPGFRATNGEIVTVARVDEQKRICLEDGRVLPATYKHFDHGYAVTAHRSQGQSVDAVVIAGETMKRELFYVAASRGREHVTVITSDKARLEASVGQSGARQSASELVQTMHGGLRDGGRPDASRGFARAIRTAAEGRRRSLRFDRDSEREAVLAPVQQPAIQAAGHERGAAVAPLERGHDDGISR
jgi:hypothetical protein